MRCGHTADRVARKASSRWPGGGAPAADRGSTRRLRNSAVFGQGCRASGIGLVWTVLLALLWVPAVIGCAVGPDYVNPETPVPDAWQSPVGDGLAAGEMDPRVLSGWWRTLGDPVLTGLVEKAVQGNLDLREARARVREARARRGIAKAGFFPTLDASGSGQVSRSGEATGSGRRTEFYTAGFDAGWELDVFGGVRRSFEAAAADLGANEENLRDVLVSLLAELALNYVEARTFEARLEVGEENLRTQQKTLQLTEWLFEAGLNDDLAVQQARYNLENTRSQLPPLRSGLEAARNRLAVLTGGPPGSVHAEPEGTGAIPVPPLEIAVGVPAEVLRRRPDVRRAERELAAQTARVGAATAELYPRFSLLGSIGLESLSLGDLFSAGSRTYQLGPTLSWPVFRAGAIRQGIEAESALQEQALNRYETAVLTALEEVENALTAFAQEQARRRSLEQAAAAARRAVELAETQYTAGRTDFSAVLDSQRSQLAFEDQLAASRGTVTGNLIRLYKALGGGWSSPAPEEAEPHQGGGEK